jgi:hypothetical protein
MNRVDLIRYGQAGLLAVATLWMAGCTGSPSSFVPASTDATTVVKMGKVMGGEVPISNAVVSLWASGTSSGSNSGVYSGSDLTPLNQTTSAMDGTGSFSFTWGGAYALPSCTKGTILYITAYSGSNGAGTNSNILHMAPIGIEDGTTTSGTNGSDCNVITTQALSGSTDFTALRGIVVNEVTSVASAYAFSGYMTLGASVGTLSTPAVDILAPATYSPLDSSSHTTNNTTGTNTVTTTSGLQHAYFNFLNLVNVSGASAGSARTAPLSNSAATAPAAVINTLANVLQYCVDSASASGSTHGDLTPCGTLYAATPSRAATYPTTTLGAVLNIAHNPNTSLSLSTFAPSTGGVPFLPSLNTAPSDWTLAIAYPVPANPYTGLGFPFMVALDGDDAVYISSPENDPYAVNGSTSTITTTSNSACLFGYSSYGAALSGVTAYVGTPGTPGNPGSGATVGSSNWYCTPNTSGTTAANAPTVLSQIEADAIGNVYMTNINGTGTSTTVPVVVKLSKSTSFDTAVNFTSNDGYAMKAIAIDKNNNVFVTHNRGSSSSEAVWEIPEGTGAGVLATGNTTGTIGSAINWLALNSNDDFLAAVLADTSYATAPYPKYDGAVAYALNTSGTWKTGAMAATAVDGGSTTSGQENSDPFAIALDAYGTPWMTVDAFANGGTNTSAVGIVPVEITSTGTASPAGTQTASWTISNLGLLDPKGLEADGNNVLWIADSSTTTGIVACTPSDTVLFNGVTSSTAPLCPLVSESGGFKPCIPNGSSGLVGCYVPDNSSTKNLAIDSTGSVWWTTPDLTRTGINNNNSLIQMIGTASPTWPLLARQTPGVLP